MYLEYILTAEDFLEFNYYVLWKAPEKKNQRLNYYFRNFFYTCLIAVIFFFIAKPQRPVEFWSVMILISAIFTFVFSGMHVKNFYNRKTREFLKDEKNQHLLEKTKLTIDHQGLIDRNSKTELKISWDGVVKIMENKKYYYLFISSIQAIIIPKNCISAEEKMQLEQLFSEHISMEATFNKFYK